MILSTLSTFSSALSNHLKLLYKLTDDIVSIGSFGDNEQNKFLNKIVVSLINIERETTAGIKFNYQATSSNQYKKTMPNWQLNLYILIAAVFSDKQYEEGLRLLSGALLFIQSNNTLIIPELNTTLAIEPVNLSFNELSNLWSICRNTYYPSILCKMRLLNIDNGEIKKIASEIKELEVD